MSREQLLESQVKKLREIIFDMENAKVKKNFDIYKTENYNSPITSHREVNNSEVNISVTYVKKLNLLRKTVFCKDDSRRKNKTSELP